MVRRGKPETDSGDVGLGGMFRSFGGFLDLLTNLAEGAEQEGGVLNRSGELGDDKKGLKAVYGFSVRVGGGGKPRIEPFGNVKRTDGQTSAVVEEVREPMVDLFDEGDHLVLVAELPGVDGSDVHFEVKEDVLVLHAARGDRKYRKEVLLPSRVSARAAVPSYHNGVFELTLPKAK